MIREFGVAPEDPVDVRFSSKLQDFVERSRHQDIVTVQEPDPVACRGIETGVARRTAAAVSLMQNLEPGIGRRERLRDFERVIAASVVHNQELEARVILRALARE